jgi:hypothetical protein
MRAFDPWIGRHYETEGLGGTKLLVLGESQYPGTEYVHHYPSGAPTPSCRSSTQEIVRDLAIENRNRFFTKVAKLVLGLPAGQWLPSDARADFWERVAFYNYVQWWLGGARFRPSQQLWAAAQIPFLEVLSELRPQVLLVLGNELANWLPTIPAAIAVVKIPHPSSKGFSYDPWAASIRLALAGPNKAVQPTCENVRG